MSQHIPFDVAVVDSNVFLRDPYALYSIQAPLVVIPFHVLEELDMYGEKPGAISNNARQAVHIFESLRLKGNLITGVPLNSEPDATILKILPASFFPDNTSTDESVLATAYYFHDQGQSTLLYSQDINMRMRAMQYGVTCKEHKAVPLTLPHELAAVHAQAMPAKELKSITNGRVLDMLSTPPTAVNQFIKLYSENNPENARFFRYLGGSQVKEVSQSPIFGAFSAQNDEQLMALDLLLDDSVKLVSLIGQAGTGKTFLILLVGLLKVLHEHTYRRIMITRPTVSLGPDIGFLPGDADEKLEAWMHPVFDNLSMISAGIKSKKVPLYLNLEELQKNNQLGLQAITYMRGRSLPYQYLFIDEAQNLTPLEMKTLVTRAGVGTKVIIAGDPDQIDAPRLNYDTNGLMVTSRKFKGDPLFGVVHLHRSERSELAQRAAELL